MMMRWLFKLTRKTVILGFAGFGMYKAWEAVAGSNARSRLPERVSRAGARLGTAVQRAEREVVEASHDAAGSVIDASRLAVAEVADEVVDVAMGSSEQVRGAHGG